MAQLRGVAAQLAPQAWPVRVWGTSEKFDSAKGEDWTAWVAHLEQVAAANRWTQAEHVTLILLYLTGSAQLFYQSLSVAVCGENLQPLLQALGDWFGPAAHIDLHYAELHTRTQQS